VTPQAERLRARDQRRMSGASKNISARITARRGSSASRRAHGAAFPLARHHLWDASTLIASSHDVRTHPDRALLAGTWRTPRPEGWTRTTPATFAHQALQALMVNHPSVVTETLPNRVEAVPPTIYPMSSPHHRSPGSPDRRATSGLPNAPDPQVAAGTPMRRPATGSRVPEAHVARDGRRASRRCPHRRRGCGRR
jgi:hypothetical protein